MYVCIYIYIYINIYIYIMVNMCMCIHIYIIVYTVHYIIIPTKYYLSVFDNGVLDFFGDPLQDYKSISIDDPRWYPLVDSSWWLFLEGCSQTCKSWCWVDGIGHVQTCGFFSNCGSVVAPGRKNFSNLGKWWVSVPARRNCDGEVGEQYFLETAWKEPDEVQRISAYFDWFSGLGDLK